MPHEYGSDSGTVRAARWSLPGGRASATVRVDSVGRYGFSIGVLTDRYGRGHRGPGPPAHTLGGRHVEQPVGVELP